MSDALDKSNEMITPASHSRAYLERKRLGIEMGEREAGRDVWVELHCASIEGSLLSTRSAKHTTKFRMPVGDGGCCGSWGRQGFASVCTWYHQTYLFRLIFLLHVPIHLVGQVQQGVVCLFVCVCVCVSVCVCVCVCVCLCVCLCA